MNLIHPLELKALIRYDPVTGKMFWKERPSYLFESVRICKTWNTRFFGQEALTTDTGNGYLAGQIHGVRYKAHRVAWAIYYGRWPDGEIDHINHNPRDNRIENLRDVSRAENLRNRPPQKNNTSGYVGVSRAAESGKWIASIGFEGKSIYLGTFEKKDDAIEVRREAEKQFGFHENGGGYVDS